MNIRFEIEQIHLPLRYEWKLSRNATSFKNNFIIRAKGGLETGLGELAPNIRYNETPDGIRADFEVFSQSLSQELKIEDWQEFLKSCPICQALKMGLDMALQRLLASQNQKTIEEWLGVPSAKPRQMAYTIPIMDVAAIKEFVKRENLDRYSWLKIKVNKETALEMIHEVLNCVSVPIAIDGNEAWLDRNEALDFLHQIPKKRVLFVEQPLPANQTADYEWLGSKSPIDIWGDESVLYHAEPEFWKKAFKGINVKLMKAGSFENAKHLLQAAKKVGLQTMIGCMVETSIGISAALALESLADYVDLDGFLLLENEQFELVKERNGIISPFYNLN